MTRLGIVTAYPKEDWHSARLLEACRTCDVPAVILDPSDFRIDCRGDAPDAGGSRVGVFAGGEHIEQFDAFLMPRAIGESGDPDLQLEVYRIMEREGALLINRVESMLSAIDKLRTSYLLTRTGLPTPRVVLVQKVEEGEIALEEMGDVVIKPVYGSLGIGIERVWHGGRGVRTTLTRLLKENGALYLQRFVPFAGLAGARTGKARDIRAFVVGGRVEAAIYREARGGEFRTNMHQGGSARPCTLSPLTADVAVRAAAVLGLEYAGVDIIESPSGPFILEVNGTPHWEGIYGATGRDMAQAIVEWACQRVERRAGRSAEERRADEAAEERLLGKGLN